MHKFTNKDNYLGPEKVSISNCRIGNTNLVLIRNKHIEKTFLRNKTMKMIFVTHKKVFSQCVGKEIEPEPQIWITSLENVRENEIRNTSLIPTGSNLLNKFLIININSPINPYFLVPAQKYYLGSDRARASHHYFVLKRCA